MAKSRWSKAQQKRDAGGFVPLSHVALRSAEFAALRPAAVKLLMDLLSQYRGNNNGELILTWSFAAERGWKSRDTLARARRELLHRGWVSLTAQGGLHKPSLYGVTLFALDPSQKLEVSVQSFPRGAWKRGGTDSAIALPSPPIVSFGTRISTPVGPIGPHPSATDTLAVPVGAG